MKLLKEGISYLFIILTVIVIRTFIVTPIIVDGSSMNTTLEDGDILLLKKYDNSYDRGDVIVFSYNDSKLIKRIIGLPGEHIKYENGILYVNGEVIEDAFSNITDDYDISNLGIETIPNGYYFVLGDNRDYSKDSRMIGLVSEDEIDGITNFSLWPIKSFK